MTYPPVAPRPTKHTPPDTITHHSSHLRTIRALTQAFCGITTRTTSAPAKQYRTQLTPILIRESFPQLEFCVSHTPRPTAARPRSAALPSSYIQYDTGSHFGSNRVGDVLERLGPLSSLRSAAGYFETMGKTLANAGVRNQEAIHTNTATKTAIRKLSPPRT